MNEDRQEEKRFKVWARHEDVRHGRLISEPSFEAAAIAYVEHLPVTAGQHELSVVVHEIQTGREHSFLIHHDPGEPVTIA